MTPRFLVSFHFYKDADLDALVADCGGSVDLFGDSGAYSAMSKGATIDRAQYAEWLQRWAHLFTTYANLDVIGDPKASAANLRWLAQRGLAPLPVFHTGSPWASLDRLAAQHDYIGLGGMVPYSTERLLPWLAEVFRRYPDHRFHGFGVSAWRLIRDLPWYSFDSSSWGAGHRYGRVAVWTGRGFDYLYLPGVVKGHTATAAEQRRRLWRHARFVRACGVDPAVFGDRFESDYHRTHAIAVSAHSWAAAEAWLAQRWQRPVRSYLADGAANNLRDAARAILGT